MRTDELLEKTKRYYEDKLNLFGPTPQGVDWNGEQSQKLRFEQLLKVCNISKSFSINDFGCGYGALLKYLLDNGYSVKYLGFDISDKMVSQAKRIFKDQKSADFTNNLKFLAPADYTVASGIFNVKQDIPIATWEEYIKNTLDIISKASKIGFAFNILTSYSDFKRDDLYYADPNFYFDYCKNIFSKNVALLNDYGLYEFTILVRKD